MHLVYTPISMPIITIHHYIYYSHIYAMSSPNSHMWR